MLCVMQSPGYVRVLPHYVHCRGPGVVLNKGASVRAKCAPHIMQRLSRASQRNVRTCTLSQCCVMFEELLSAPPHFLRTEV